MITLLQIYIAYELTFLAYPVYLTTDRIGGVDVNLAGSQQFNHSLHIPRPSRSQQTRAAICL